MSFFSAILSKFLDQYINKVNGKQVKFSILDGHAELHNVSFTENLLISLGIPLIIKESRVDQVIVDFPIIKNSKKSAYLKVNNVDIFASPKWDALNKISDPTIADVIQSIEDEKKVTKLEKRKVWNNWLEKVIDNASIEITNIRIHIEYSNKNNKTSAITLFLESLLMNTIDSNGEKIILQKKPEILTKKVTISSFAISLQTNIEPFKTFNQLNDINFNLLQESSFNFTMVHDRRENSSFLNSFSLSIDPIFINLTREQFFSLQDLFDDFSKNRKRQKFQSCMRPLSNKIDDKHCIKMWSYLHRCGVKIRRAHDFRPNLALKFLKERKEFVQDSIKSISKKKYVKKSIKKYGEDLAFLLFQYTSIIIRRNERMIHLDQKEIDTIASEDLQFFSEDSLHFQVNFQGICINMNPLFLLSVNDIKALYEKKRSDIKLKLEIKNWLIDDLNSNYQVIQTNENDDFVLFQIDSRDNPALLKISSFKIDIRSCFLNSFCHFFANPKIEKMPKTPQKVKSSSLNEYLLMLNPRTLMRFKIILSGFSVFYSIGEDEKSSELFFNSEVHQIQLKNYSKSSTENKLIIKTKMQIGQINLKGGAISEGFSLKSKTIGIIDQFYYLQEITTNLDILNAQIKMNSQIIEIIENVLSSITCSTSNYSTKIYSKQVINMNCSDISIFVNTGRNAFSLKISGIDINPSLQFRNIAIIEQSGAHRMDIPLLRFNGWPIIETEELTVDLKANEFYSFLDEINWISGQATKISNSLFPSDSNTDQNSNSETNSEIASNSTVNTDSISKSETNSESISNSNSASNSESISNSISDSASETNSITVSNQETNPDAENQDFNLQIIAHLIKYKIGGSSNLIMFNEVAFLFGIDYIFTIESFYVMNSKKQKFLICDNKMSYIMSTINEIIYLYATKIPELYIEFMWDEMNCLYDYYQNLGPNYYENVEYTDKYKYLYTIEIEKLTIDIDKSIKIVINNLLYDYLYPELTWGFYFEKMEVDNFLKICNFNFQNNIFYFDLFITSISIYLSPEFINKVKKISFFERIINSDSKTEQNESSKSQNDMNVNVNNILIAESLTKLTLFIPSMQFTKNSLYSISALFIPKITFEHLVFNMKIILLYDSIEYDVDDINSIFLLERKPLTENKELNLSNIFVTIDSIDFEYTHYFMMRIYNAFKIRSNYSIEFNFNKSDAPAANYDIHAVIHLVKIRESILSDSILLEGLSFEKTNDLIMFKCNSINCFDLIRKSKENENLDFFIIEKNNEKLSLIINPFDIYLNINTIEKLTNIYESLNSLYNTNYDEKLALTEIKGNESSLSFSIDVSGVQIHFPFDDDPLFQKHDLILSFNLQINNDEKNFCKLLKITQINLFFANYTKQKELDFMPLLDNFSFQILLKTNDERKYISLDIEIGQLNAYLSVLDLFEFQLIAKNFHPLIFSLLNPKTYLIYEGRKFDKNISIEKSVINVRPISISICEEGRASLPIFTIFIETTSSTLNLTEANHEFAIVMNISIKHNNFSYGKFETFMPPTEFLIIFSKSDANEIYFGFSVKTDIDFNLTPYSFRSLIRFVDKFQNKEKILESKDISRFNYNPEYWIRNSLNDNLSIRYSENGSDSSNSILFISPGERLPLCQINQDMILSFTYKGIQGSFIPRKLIFPTYFKSVSVSIHHHDNYSQTIEFISPLSIENKLDSKITIYINSEQNNKHFDVYTVLRPKCSYPLPLEERSYFILSDFQQIDDANVKKSRSQKLQPTTKSIHSNLQIDKSHPPEIFTISKNKYPPIIRIQNIENKNSISFNLIVNNCHQTNSRILEIVPSFFIKNRLPCMICSQIYNKENQKVNNGLLILQSQAEIQINLFNHDLQNLFISLSFDYYSFKEPTVVKLDKLDEVFAGNEGTAIVVKKLLQTEQKEIIIFSPCAIFNKTDEIIYFSPSLKPKTYKILPQDFTLYGLDSYSDENKKSMKIDVYIESSEKKIKAIDCMRLNSNCTTIYLPRTDNHDLFYPINCSITLGKFPMNTTHIMTFTNYLYVINNLPFDFSLVPITSSKLDLLESNIDNIEKIHQEIENESQFLLNDSFFLPHNESSNDENKVLINWIPKNGMFFFSVNEYPNNPIINLNSVTRTIFMVKNKKDKIYIELNIYEDKSTLYASFQTPSFPPPLIVNNSLNSPIIIYQNIKPYKNKLLIDPHSSSLFAFDEPFINNKEIFIAIPKNNETSEDSNIESETDSNEKIKEDSTIMSNSNSIEKIKVDINAHKANSIEIPNIKTRSVRTMRNSRSIERFNQEDKNSETIDKLHQKYKIFLFSMESQLSPLVSSEFNVNIFTTIISKNNSKMIQVRYLDDVIVYQSSFRGFLSIHSFRFSLSNDEMNEIVLFTLKDINSEICQDNKNTFWTLFIRSIQLDDQNTATQIPVCLYGSGKDLLNENKHQTNKFFNLFSIFPRGVPLFSVINYLSIQIKPIFIVAESTFLVNLLSFLMTHFMSIYKHRDKNSIDNEASLKPSFNSVNVNKILISYLEINPINIIINIPSETKNDGFYIATVKWLLKMISMNNISISFQKLFMSDFNNNISYMIDLFRNFYGKELMKQISKNALIQFFASYLIHFKKFHFLPLTDFNHDSSKSDKKPCDNRKPLFQYFNQIELIDIEKQSNFYFHHSPDVIRQLLDRENPPSNIMICHPNSHENQTDAKNRNYDRLIVGVSNDANLISKNCNIDIVQLFNSKEIKRVRIPYISPIYSSFDDPLSPKISKADSNFEDIIKLNNSSEIFDIYIKIQSEILKNKKLEHSNIKFIIQDKTKELLYCVTNELVLIFEMNKDLIKLSKQFNLMDFSSVEASDNIVHLSFDNSSIGKIQLEFNRKTDAKSLVSFINSQQTIIGIFGHALDKI